MVSVQTLKITKADDQFFNLTFLDTNNEAIDISTWIVQFLKVRGCKSFQHRT